MNLLIQAENLTTLKELTKIHKSKIKLIYIDPPYNRQNKTFQYNDSRRENEWIDFMEPRLSAAKALISETGSIWISIDDTECHYLKVLCDNIFGETTSYQQSFGRKNIPGANDSRHLSNNHDYILVYAKDKKLWEINRFPRTEELTHDTQIQITIPEANGNPVHYTPRAGKTPHHIHSPTEQHGNHQSVPTEDTQIRQCKDLRKITKFAFKQQLPERKHFYKTSKD